MLKFEWQHSSFLARNILLQILQSFKFNWKTVLPQTYTPLQIRKTTDSATQLTQLLSIQLKKRIPFASTHHPNPDWTISLLAKNQIQIANNTTCKQITKITTQNYHTRTETNSVQYKHAFSNFQPPNRRITVVMTHLPRRDWPRNHHLRPHESFQSAQKNRSEISEERRALESKIRNSGSVPEKKGKRRKHLIWWQKRVREWS